MCVSQVQDAQAAMRLYTLVKKQWEMELKAGRSRGREKNQKKPRPKLQPDWTHEPVDLCKSHPLHESKYSEYGVILLKCFTDVGLDCSDVSLLQNVIFALFYCYSTVVASSDTQSKFETRLWQLKLFISGNVNVYFHLVKINLTWYWTLKSALVLEAFLI